MLNLFLITAWMVFSKETTKLSSSFVEMVLETVQVGQFTQFLYPYVLPCISTAGIKSCIRESNTNRYFQTLSNYAEENNNEIKRGLVVYESIMISPIVGSKPPIDIPLCQLLIDVGVGWTASTCNYVFLSLVAGPG